MMGAEWLDPAADEISARILLRTKLTFLWGRVAVIFSDRRYHVDSSAKPGSSPRDSMKHGRTPPRPPCLAINLAASKKRPQSAIGGARAEAVQPMSIPPDTTDNSGTLPLVPDLFLQMLLCMPTSHLGSNYSHPMRSGISYRVFSGIDQLARARWRGWGEADIASLSRKLDDPAAYSGGIVKISDSEHRAWGELGRRVLASGKRTTRSPSLVWVEGQGLHSMIRVTVAEAPVGGSLP